MKKILLAVFALGVLATFNGCKKEAPDPCDNIVCHNGGTCANGLCNCPDGYTGSDCGQEKAVVSVTVDKIVLKKYPMTNASGAGWDFNNGPDVYLSINQGTSANNTTFVTGVHNDATGQQLTFTGNLPINLNSPGNNYTIGVWDKDSPDADDFMGGLYFTPTSIKGQGFPATVELNAGGIEMTVHVRWNF